MPDRPEFEQYVAARSQRLHQLAYLLTGDWAAAEDLVQTALVKAWFAWRRVEGDPDAYVRRIIATTHTSWRRRRWSGEVSIERLPEHGEPDRSHDHAEADLLWRALLALPQRQRAVLVLRYFEDLSQEQTAATLGVKVGTVKSLTGRALATLRADPTLNAVTTDQLTRTTKGTA